MDTSPEQIESLNKDIEKFEKKARRRVWLSTAIPLLFGVILLGYTIWQIQITTQKLVSVQTTLNQTSRELSTTTTSLQDTKSKLDQANVDLANTQNKLDATFKELEQSKQELEKIKSQLDQTTQELRNANLFVANSVAIDIVDIKRSSLYLYPPQEEVLLDILFMQMDSVEWNLNGFSETDGFNSPNFAIYMLQKHGLISNDYAAGSKPWDILKPVHQPSIGDIVYYEGGYTMFYFELNGQEFVIGMTPLGILAQKIDFAPILGYLQVPY
ncbi:MAG: hypothetical protein Q8K92_26490 [Leadbetterella sp.]|nr:hypothetical protein [Leadbetterella sp.]